MLQRQPRQAAHGQQPINGERVTNAPNRRSLRPLLSGISRNARFFLSPTSDSAGSTSFIILALINPTNSTGYMYRYSEETLEQQPAPRTDIETGTRSVVKAACKALSSSNEKSGIMRVQNGCGVSAESCMHQKFSSSKDIGLLACQGY